MRISVSPPTTDDDASWRPRRDVLWCSHGDVTTLLSLHTGEYYTLDHTGTAIWDHLRAGDTLRGVANGVARQFDVDNHSGCVIADVQQFVRGLSARRLIEPATAPLTTTKPFRRIRSCNSNRSDRIPSTLTCFLGLFVIHVAVRVLGLAPVLRYILMRRIEPLANHAPDQWVRATLRRVYTASAFYPLNAACLQQSLLILRLAHNAGIDATFRLGVHPYPFAAHAWVEVSGEPLNETRESLDRYRPLPIVDLAHL